MCIQGQLGCPVARRQTAYHSGCRGYHLSCAMYTLTTCKEGVMLFPTVRKGFKLHYTSVASQTLYAACFQASQKCLWLPPLIEKDQQVLFLIM